MRSCPDQVFCCPVGKENSPKTGADGLFNTQKDVRRTSLQFADIQDCRRIFWVDSSTVLSWIRTPSQKFKPFVSARVAEIQETVGVDDFRYIRSTSNLADTLTRGTELSRLTDWLEGPTFLQLPEANWATFRAEDQSIHVEEAEVLEEMKTSEKSNTSSKHRSAIADVNVVKHEATTAEANVKLGEDNTILHQLLKTCSTFSKIRRTRAYVRCFAVSPKMPERRMLKQALSLFKNQLFT